MTNYHQRMTTLIVGDNHTGKSSIVSRIMGDDRWECFARNGGDNIHIPNCKIKIIKVATKSKNLRLEACDMPGFRYNINNNIMNDPWGGFKHMHACIIVIDVNDKNTLKIAQEYIQKEQEKSDFFEWASGGHKAPILVLGNKIDLRKNIASNNNNIVTKQDINKWLDSISWNVEFPCNFYDRELWFIVCGWFRRYYKNIYIVDCILNLVEKFYSERRKLWMYREVSALKNQNIKEALNEFLELFCDWERYASDLWHEQQKKWDRSYAMNETKIKMSNCCLL